MSGMPDRTKRPSRAPHVDAERLWARHMEMAGIGTVAGTGSRRLALSSEDGAARDLLARWCRAAGMEVDADRAGNMFAVRAGRDPSRRPVASGSHLDTQPMGGRFDGVSGVLAALEVVEALNDAGLETEAPLAVVNWTNEEGVRFAPGLMGSSWYAGAIADDALDATQDGDGACFADEAARIGWRGDLPARAIPFDAFFELHIEQGPVLERAGAEVGIVTAVQGLRWLDVAVTGKAGHAGTTPLEGRRDALLAAAAMLCAVNAAGRQAGPDARVSVGRLIAATDGPSSIVGESAFVVDIRHPDADALAVLTARCAAICREVGGAQDCEVTVRERIAIRPQQFDDDCIAALDAAAEALGLRKMALTSGALHDACNIAPLSPTGMVFVPCRDGLSHHVDEYASPQALASGARVLLGAMLARANRL